jgi:hypothetical protein
MFGVNIGKFPKFQKFKKIVIGKSKRFIAKKY